MEVKSESESWNTEMKIFLLISIFRSNFVIEHINGTLWETISKKNMRITINNEQLDAPSADMTVREIMAWRNIPDSGTAVAVNNRLVTRLQWDAVQIKEGDNLTLISAAFGG